MKDNDWWALFSDIGKTRIRMSQISAVITESVGNGKNRMTVVLNCGKELEFASVTDKVVEYFDEAINCSKPLFKD